MKILILTLSYPPEVNSIAVLFGQLASGLARRGHEVTVVTRIPRFYLPAGTDKLPRRLFLESLENSVRVRRVAVPPVPRRIPALRALEQFVAAGTFFANGLLAGRFDAALVYTPPLPLALSAWGLRLARKIPFVLNVQDLYPQTAIDLGLLKNSALIRISEKLERFAYRHADRITVHSRGNLEHVTARGANPNNVTVLSNWVDTNELIPGTRENSFRSEHGLGRKLTVTFAGVMGFAQGLDVVIGAAALLRDRLDIQFLLIGEGVMRKNLEIQVVSRSLTNVKFLPLQPPEVYTNVLAASDIGLVTLSKDLKTPVVPGKVQSIMAAGRPIVASVSLQGDASRIIKDAKCGLITPPGDPSEMANAIETLADDPELRANMGESGRRYAVEHFSVEAAVENYVTELEYAARGGPNKGAQVST